ncbi:hypothetical protein JRQ81_018808 [Phrynocephalus forsythii]|uniref:Uncharacterized protein n=1 Tax=Phrynocephalus forsythii TaxID=171643 RepID=A0A9Q1AZ37_9SAUR|nr:hypothetical protein JRQ81_018808 [Phrynocephalus forsythii]
MICKHTQGCVERDSWKVCPGIPALAPTCTIDYVLVHLHLELTCISWSTSHNCHCLGSFVCIAPYFSRSIDCDCMETDACDHGYHMHTCMCEWLGEGSDVVATRANVNGLEKGAVADKRASCPVRAGDLASLPHLLQQPQKRSQDREAACATVQRPAAGGSGAVCQYTAGYKTVPIPLLLTFSSSSWKEWIPYQRGYEEEEEEVEVEDHLEITKRSISRHVVVEPARADRCRGRRPGNLGRQEPRGVFEKELNRNKTFLCLSLLRRLPFSPGREKVLPSPPSTHLLSIGLRNKSAGFKDFTPSRSLQSVSSRRKQRARVSPGPIHFTLDLPVGADVLPRPRDLPPTSRRGAELGSGGVEAERGRKPPGLRSGIERGGPRGPRA